MDKARLNEAFLRPVFDYRALRLLIGLIVFSLPVTTWLISSVPLSSISASYHTEARDVFVGSLFAVGALLWAYNGHSLYQKRVSKVAAVAALVTALFPTAGSLSSPGISTTLHYIGAVVLFSTIAYFCLGPFRYKTLGQGGKKGRRALVYLLCGHTIILSMLAVGVSALFMSDGVRESISLVYIAELVALWAFGVAWIVAGKVIPLLADPSERLMLSLK